MRALLPVALLLLPPGIGLCGPIPGLGILCPAGEAGTVGELAARELGRGFFGGVEVSADGQMAVPAGVRALWWHCETSPLPAAMQTAAVKRALCDWLGQGHGLFVSGTAPTYVSVMGLEPTSTRVVGGGGQDGFVAAVAAGDYSRHPVYEGFDTNAPIPLVGGGYPPFSDFYGSGGPQAGNPIGEAAPDAGEHPLVEFACGQGRVIAMGWRLPHYGLRPNAHRANLERLTGNVLCYLASGDWYGTIEDGRTRALRAELERIDGAAVERAVRDLASTFGERYPRSERYLALLARIPEAKAAFDRGDPAAPELARRIVDEVAAALLDNPVLDFDRLLLVKRGVGQMGLPQNWESNSTLPRTGYDNEIAVLSPVAPEGSLSTLYRPDGGEFVGDVDLDFDAHRILFSMPPGGGPWRVCEMAVEGGEPRALPLVDEPDVDNYDACYLPDGNVIFTSTAPFVGVPCVTGSSHVANVFRYDRASGAVRELSFGQDHDWCPTVLPSGRLLYLRWEYTDLPHFVSRILFTMDPDGCGQREFYGSNSYWPNALFYARPLPGTATGFVAVVGGHHDHPRMGELVVFDSARGRHEADGAVQRLPGYGRPVEPIVLDGLTYDSWPKFLHPYPLSDKYFLVSARPTPAANWGIYLVDVFDNMTLICEAPGYALLEPLPLRPTPRPPVIPDRVDTTRKDALVYLADVYSGDGLRGVPRGTVKRLRLSTYHFAYHGMGGQVDRVGFDGPWDVRRIVGTVPVAEDGSAYFRVPANTPISLQPLDESGQALQLMRSWLTAMPGETLSCVGCHEQQSDAPPNLRTAASHAVPAQIEPWYGPARGFSFDREVQPVLDRHCISCHDGSEGLPDLRRRPPVRMMGDSPSGYNDTLFPPAYLELRRFVRGATIESDMHLLMPGEFAADTTQLVRMLRKGHHGVEPDSQAWDRLITWIDLNAPAHGTWTEIVGEQRVAHQSERRMAMLARYAGREDDPERVPEESTPGAPRAGTPDHGDTEEPHEPAGRGAQLPGPAAAALVCPNWPFSAEEARQRQGVGDRPELTVDVAPGIALELVRIPEGEFLMGARDGFADEAPQSRVAIEHAFWMGKFEVTNAQFRACIPSHDSRHEVGDFLQFGVEERGYPVDGDRQPVVRVSWEQATAFCSLLSERTGRRFCLPTEAQWEWACRAGSETAMWWGDAGADFSALGNLADGSFARVDTFAPWGLPSGAMLPWRPGAKGVDDGFKVSAPVGSFAPNPWGLHDMHGNVWEWTASGYAPYPYTGGVGGVLKVARGGSWSCTPRWARSACRLGSPAYRGVYDVGFRVVMQER